MNRDKLLVRAALLAVAVGLGASVVAQVVHLRTYTVPETSSFCTVARQLDCTTVSLSRWAVAFGVPLPVWGIAGFVAMGIALVRRSWLLLPLSAVGAAASVALLLVEIRVLRTVCLVCEAVHVASWAVLILAVLLRRQLSPPSKPEALRALGPPGVIVLLTWALLPRYWAIASWSDPVTLPHGVDAEGHHWIGAENPEVTLHEYVHYGCPHCVVGMSRTRRWLLSRGDRVRFVRHQQPLGRCPKGSDKCQFVRLAACAADQGKFWEADAWLFAHAPGRKLVDPDKAAKDLGLDAPALEACMASEKTFDRIDAEAARTFEQGRTVVPSYYLDDKALNLREVEKLLEGL
jgi:uncharacterized membrane protein